MDIRAHPAAPCCLRTHPVTLVPHGQATTHHHRAMVLAKTSMNCGNWAYFCSSLFRAAGRLVTEFTEAIIADELEYQLCSEKVVWL